MKILCVRYHKTGKLNYYNNKETDEIVVGDYIIAETQYGQSIGRVVKILEQSNDITKAEEYIKKATEEDLETKISNEAKAKEALEKAKEVATRMKLDMKFLSTEYTFDKTKLVFFFAAEERVDFRELVKELASMYRLRIELRQVGARDEIKSCPNLGSCGKEVCCRTFLPDFEPVTVKMAKEQGLQINMQKLSGACGRLKCCLKFEQEVYEEKNKKMPKYGEIVATKKGTGKVVQVEILKEKFKIKVDDPDDSYHFETVDASEIIKDTKKEVK
ncbi:MAG: regulatory iron-sulfur-containing complex subunit RicT [Clostridia bacterium]